MTLPNVPPGDTGTNEEDLADFEGVFRNIARRYGGVSPDALARVLTPIYIPILSIDPTIRRYTDRKGGPLHATFKVKLTDDNKEIVRPGRTGKFVPGVFKDGAGVWGEVAKGRFTEVDDKNNVGKGEVYVGSGGGRKKLEEAIGVLTTNDYLEIDRYGVGGTLLSALVEEQLSTQLRAAGYTIYRMPEDTARHLGIYPNYDFDVVSGDQVRKVEVKSLWGTNTDYARLIHSKSRGPDKGQPNYYATSSCKFATQHIFAVSLFLRTGNIRDFAFARSIPEDQAKYGLPRASKYPDYVHQNPECTVGDGVWYGSIEDVWDL